MDKKETIDLMGIAVDAFNAYSLDIFDKTDCDTALIGMIVSKEHGQMLINGPFDNENLIAMLLIAASGAGREIEMVSEVDHRVICDVAKKDNRSFK